MNEIIRYEETPCHEYPRYVRLDPDPHGDWVRYENHIDIVVKLQARITELEEAVKEALAMSEGEWATVDKHPASRFAADVEYFRKVLDLPK